MNELTIYRSDVRPVQRWAFAGTLLGLLLMALFFGPTDNWAWDPSFYYAHIRSPVVDHDLDFRNETKTGSIDLGSTETGLQNSEWPVGPSLLWSPFFLAAHGIVLTLSPDQADGFAAPYMVLVSLGSLAYGVVALVMIYRLCRAHGGRATSLTAICLCLVATPLFFYMFRQPLMAHTTGLFATAAMLTIYLECSRSADLNRRSGLLFGVALGLCFLTRWNGLLMGLVPAVYFAGYIIEAVAERSARKVWLAIRQIGLFLALFLLTITPQLAMWYRLHGRFFALPQGGGAFVGGPLPINLLKIFFDTNRGLVFWCPFVLLGMIGIACIPHARLRYMAAAITLGQVVLIGYRVDWYSGGGFGARYFIELLPFLAIGVVCLLRYLPARAGWAAAAGVAGAALALHQAVLLYTIEHQLNGWVDIASYFHGQPLGIRWQLDALLRLLAAPSLWLAPRAYVGEDRQTLLTNLVAGLHNPRAYLITGTALIVAPAVALLAALAQRLCRRFGAASLMAMVAAYFAAWSVYFLRV